MNSKGKNDENKKEHFYTTKEEIDALVDALRKSGDFLDAYFA